MKHLLYYLSMAFSVLLFATSCDKDKKKDNTTDSTAKVISNLDASAYDKWVYFSFETGISEIRSYKESAPGKWDVAFHRENVKTNDGSAMKTDKTGLDALTEVPVGEYVKDEMTTDKVIVDMSQMMQGKIGYDTTAINMAVNGWVTRSGMPPVYTVGDNVYVFRTKDGKHAKLKFTSYKNDSDKTGFVSFTYVYPF